MSITFFMGKECLRLVRLSSSSNHLGVVPFLSPQFDTLQLVSRPDLSSTGKNIQNYLLEPENMVKTFFSSTYLHFLLRGARASLSRALVIVLVSTVQGIS